MIGPFRSEDDRPTSDFERGWVSDSISSDVVGLCRAKAGGAFYDVRRKWGPWEAGNGPVFVGRRRSSSESGFTTSDEVVSLVLSPLGGTTRTVSSDVVAVDECCGLGRSTKKTRELVSSNVVGRLSTAQPTTFDVLGDKTRGLSDPWSSDVVAFPH